MKSRSVVRVLAPIAIALGVGAQVKAGIQLIGLTNSIWAYRADNSDQYALGFPDVDTSSWPTGRGLFGNDASGGYPFPFVTTVGGSSVGVQSSYYQTSFSWSGNAAGVTLVLTNYIDDGVVIYLNNVEITRWNVQAGFGAPVEHQTMAAAANPGGEPVKVVHRVVLDALTNGNANPLRVGQNVLAASVHQAGTGSSDSVFGLSLRTPGEEFLCGAVSPASTNAFQCQDVKFVLNVPPLCQQPFVIQWYHNGSPLAGETDTTLTLRNVQPGVDDGTYVARLSGFLGTVDSVPGSLVVTPDSEGPRILAITGTGLNEQWRIVFNEKVDPAGGAADPATYEIRAADDNHVLPVTSATVQPNGDEVVLLTSEPRVLPAVYTVSTTQGIRDACAGNESPAGLSGPFLYESFLVDYADSMVWRYSDAGVDYGTAWRYSGFDDSGWKSGRQMFHRDRSDLEQAVVAGQIVRSFLELTNFAANPPTNLPTVYLRLKLFVPLGASYVTGYPLYDDGFILYFNGVEVHRRNVSAAADEWANFSGGSSVEAGAPGSGAPFLIPLSLVNWGGENTIAVMLKQVDRTSGDLTFGLRISAEGHVDLCPSIIEVPVATTATEGHAFELRVVTAGGIGTGYQWFQNGNPIPGATSSVYRKAASLTDAGEYSVEILCGSTRTPPVTVSVRPVVVSYAHLWRYSTNSQNASLLTTPWYATGFDDSAWAVGPGPFGRETTAAAFARLPTPLSTALPVPGESFVTAYFRTTIDVPPVPEGSTLVLTHFIDDGAAIYVDDVLALRYNLTNDPPILSSALAPATVPGDGDAMLVSVPVTLSPGPHSIAVEVHQNSATSSDVVFGAELRAISGPAPSLTITQPTATSVQVTWTADSQYSLNQATNIGGPFTAVGGNPQGNYAVANIAPDAARYFQLRFNGR